MRIVVVGSLYGQLDQVYRETRALEKQHGLIDLVVVCGNFQAFRNPNDLANVSAPAKYKKLGDFHDYFTGKKQASHLTLVVGGNYEASSYFQALPYGGWIAPDIFFMGYSNVIKFNGVRIAAVSGIYNRFCLLKGRYEHLPYDQNSIKTINYTRYLEVFRMLQVQEKIDVMLTHDWPDDLPGSEEFLLRKKPFLEKSIVNHELASPLHKLLLDKLKPKHWFAGHLHVRFQTNYAHKAPEESGGAKVEKTRFLALNKCAPNRLYLEMVDVPSDEFNLDGLEYDLEWLAILRVTNHLATNQIAPPEIPPQPYADVEFDFEPEKVQIKEWLNNDFEIPDNFVIELPCKLDGDQLEDVDPGRQKNYANRQTKQFCSLLGLKDTMQGIINLTECKVENPDKIDISDSDSVVDWSDTLEKSGTSKVDSPMRNRFRDRFSDRFSHQNAFVPDTLQNALLDSQNVSSNNPNNLNGGILAIPSLPTGFNSILNQPVQRYFDHSDSSQLPIEYDRAIESRPTIESLPAIESRPEIECSPAIESRPTIESHSAAESRLAIEFRPIVESRPVIASLPAAESRQTIESRLKIEFPSALELQVEVMVVDDDDDDCMIIEPEDVVNSAGELANGSAQPVTGQLSLKAEPTFFRDTAEDNDRVQDRNASPATGPLSLKAEPLFFRDTTGENNGIQDRNTSSATDQLSVKVEPALFHDQTKADLESMLGRNTSPVTDQLRPKAEPMFFCDSETDFESMNGRSTSPVTNQLRPKAEPMFFCDSNANFESVNGRGTPPVADQLKPKAEPMFFKDTVDQ